MTWRPSLEEVMRVAANIHGAPVPELATPDVLQRARYAVALPEATVYGMPVYATIPEKTVALVASLLRNPPLHLEIGKLAYRVGRAFADGNDHRWDAREQVSVVRFESELGREPMGEALQEWLQPRVIPIERQRSRRETRLAPPRWLRLFDPRLPGRSWRSQRAQTHVVFVAGPLSKLDDAERELLRPLNDALKSAVEEATEVTGLSAPLAIEYPSLELSPEAAPDLEHRQVWHRNRELILSETDAMIICDVGIRAAGFGAAMELDLMVRQGGPILYLEAAGCEAHSRYLFARSDELDLTIEVYRDLEHAGEIARDWIVQRAPSIEESARLRDDRRYAGELIAQRLSARWETLTDDQHIQVLGGLHLTPPTIEAAVENPVLLEPLLGSDLPVLCNLLGIEHESAPEEISLKTTGPSWAALIDAAVDQRWDGAFTEELWTSAVSEIAAADPSLARDGLRTKEAWIERARGR